MVCSYNPVQLQTSMQFNALTSQSNHSYCKFYLCSRPDFVCTICQREREEWVIDTSECLLGQTVYYICIKVYFVEIF